MSVIDPVIPENEGNSCSIDRVFRNNRGNSSHYYPSYLSCKGFTLLEVLIVLVMLGLMAALLPPRLAGVIDSTRTKAVAREFVSALRQTRNLAISQQKEALLSIDLDQKSFLFGNNKKGTVPDTIKLSLFTASSEIVAENQAAIRFYPDGSSTGGRITLSTETQKIAVDINWLTGKIAILDELAI